MAGIQQNTLEEYKCDANDVITFKLVREDADVDQNDGFKPEMTHQIFGEQESIFGYKDLCVQVFYTAAKLNTYINLKYTDKVTPQNFDGLQADDVVSTLAKQVPPGFYTNIDDFRAAVVKDATFKPFGELLHSYTVNKDGEDRTFEIYKTDIQCPGFKEYHERLQTFILFFIDAASYIDVDDEKWNFYLLFEKYKNNGSPMHAVVGYMTVYNYYAYPCSIRPRISQVLVLPPFQKQGHGAQLLQTFYNSCYGNSDVKDIAVEDPSENFERLRDFVDARNCLKLKSFQPDKLKEGFDEDMVRDARCKLKLSRRQVRHVYEILRLKVTDVSNKEEYTQYRLDIKRRLNAPFQKNCQAMERIEKALQPDEMSATLTNMTLQQKHEYLQKAFEEQVDAYRHVIERLNVA